MGLGIDDSALRQFNYNGVDENTNISNIPEENVEQLEEEIEMLLKRKPQNYARTVNIEERNNEEENDEEEDEIIVAPHQ